jgi:hypothetical protein
MIGEFLLRVVTALDMNEIPYMLTGSLASSMYGVPRATNDVDIVIEPNRAQLVSLVQLFERVGLTAQREAALEAFRNRSQFNVIDFRRGWKVDLMIRKDREFSTTEFARKETHEVEGMRLTLATPEDVLLAKLEWFKIGESQQQLDDVVGILRMQSETLDVEYIEHWVDALDVRKEWTAARERAG